MPCVVTTLCKVLNIRPFLDVLAFRVFKNTLESNMSKITQEPEAIEIDTPLACIPCSIEETSLNSDITISVNGLSGGFSGFANTKTSTILEPKESKSNLQEIVAQVSPIVSLFGGLFIFYKYLADRKESRRLKQIEKLESQLRTFFGPLKELREESKGLYEIFAVQFKHDYEAEHGRRFRTLRYLRNNKPESLPQYDQEILKSIINISKKNIDFIEEHGGAIESTALSSLLGSLCAHFRVMEIGAEGKLVDAPTRLEEVVFPLETDGAIDNEIKKINCKLNKLRNNLPIKLRAKRVLKHFMSNKTIQFYDNNAENYYRETNHVDMSNSYDRFRKHVVKGGRLLDAGCGVGRDTRYFISKGYKVQSFDLSRKMCEITRKYPYSFCTQMSFLDVDFYEEYDGIWANASLLHVADKKMPEVISRLARSLKVGGYLFASFKSDKNFESKDNRKFYFYKREDLDRFIELSKYDLVLEESWSSFKGNDPNNEEFQSYIWKRRS